MAFYPINQSLVTWSHKVAKEVGKYSFYFGHLGVQLCTEVLPLQKKGRTKVALSVTRSVLYSEYYLDTKTNRDTED